MKRWRRRVWRVRYRGAWDMMDEEGLALGIIIIVVATLWAHWMTH